jgi:hypothetical protein
MKPVQAWPDTFEAMAAERLAFSGSPRTLVESLSRELDETGANYLVGQFVFGDMSLAESARSIGLFASEVMPSLSRAFQLKPSSLAGKCV